MFINRSAQNSRLPGILSIPYFLLVIYLIKESSARIHCYTSKDVKVEKKYRIIHSGYQDKDNDNTHCTWDLKAPENYAVRLNCTMNLTVEDCVIQGLDVYRDFNGTMNSPDKYCKNITFTTTSIARSLRIVNRSALHRATGNFICDIVAVPAPVVSSALV